MWHVKVSVVVDDKNLIGLLKAINESSSERLVFSISQGDYC